VYIVAKSKSFLHGSNIHNGGSISNSGQGRARSDNYAKPSKSSGDYSWSRAIANFGAPKKQRPDNYGKGKHSGGGHPKQNHW
jgi:hypothetical protein